MPLITALVITCLLLFNPAAWADPGDGFLIRLDPAMLQKFGLYYPVTYKFRLPPGSRALSAHYRYGPADPWIALPELPPGTRFNGVDVVRFDYATGFVYASIRFSRSSNTIYLHFSDVTGLPVAVEFNSIPTYYDERRAAVTLTLDDWAPWSNMPFQKASDYLGARGIYFTVGLITDNVPWVSVQQKITQLGDMIEIASHSTSHPCSAAQYAVNGYAQEIIGSRDAIRAKLQFASSPYVPVFIDPCSYSDVTLTSTVSAGDYLVSRGKGPAYTTPYVAWDETLARYNHARGTIGTSNRVDDANLLMRLNTAFDTVLAANGVHHIVDHPNQGLWHDGSNLLKHLDYIKERNDIWYVPLGPMYQYHYVQEMRGNLAIQNLGKPTLTPSFSTSVSNGRAPLTVAFTDTTPTPTTAWRWDFGDSTLSTEQNPQHVYAIPGTYTVKLTRTGPSGISSTSTTLTVSPAIVQIASPLNTTIMAAQASIPITAAVSPNPSNPIVRVDFMSGVALLGTAVAQPFSIPWSGATAGDYTLLALATDSLGTVAASQPVSIRIVNSTLPTPWMSQDISDTGATGTSVFANGGFTVSAAGKGIEGSEDSFRFIFQPLAGDGQIIARVRSLDNTNPSAKAGVMFRQGISADAAYVMMAISPGKPADLLRRPASGALLISTAGPLPTVTPPYWVKLTRSGSNYSGYISQEGATWTLIDSDTIRMNDPMYVGLAITSHRYGTLSTAIFDNVTVIPGPVKAAKGISQIP